MKLYQICHSTRFLKSRTCSTFTIFPSDFSIEIQLFSLFKVNIQQISKVFSKIIIFIKVLKMSKNKKIEETEEFIFFFRKETCLWNVCCPEYHDRNLKDKAMKNLSKSVEISGKNILFDIIF